MQCHVRIPVAFTDRAEADPLTAREPDAIGQRALTAAHLGLSRSLLPLLFAFSLLVAGLLAALGILSLPSSLTVHAAAVLAVTGDPLRVPGH